MVDVQRQYQQLKTDIDRRVLACMESGAYINGPDVKNFEASLSFYLDNTHVVSCANGTDALQVALMAPQPPNR
jgi:dTDP-4-amino-4,6-dideoxygalactose transaminase